MLDKSTKCKYFIMIKPFINKAFPEVLKPDDENFKLIDKNSLKMQFYL